jgi:hypothetical protein
MNRRTTLKFLMAITFISPSNFSQVEKTWVKLDNRILKPNSRSISVDMYKARGITKLGIELRGNSIWLYHLKLLGSEDSRILPVNLNIPLTPKGCPQRLTVWQIDGQTQNAELKFECLPLTSEPTEILVWGSA